jgi:hypothetical protein
VFFILNEPSIIVVSKFGELISFLEFKRHCLDQVKAKNWDLVSANYFFDTVKKTPVRCIKLGDKASAYADALIF